MKPERASQTYLSITRSKGKMYEFDVPLDDHIKISVDLTQLFPLAIGLLGDAAATIANRNPDDGRQTAPASLTFAGIFFDAYIQSRLNQTVDPEFGVLSSAAYYLSDSPGNAAVVIRRVDKETLPGGTALCVLTYQLLNGTYDKFEDSPYADHANNLLTAFERFYALAGNDQDINATIDAIRLTAYDNGSDRDIIYADIISSVSILKVAYATRTVIPHASNLALDVWEPALRKRNSPREMWPSQRRIADAGILRGLPGVIQMPTSAGKTRATEFIIRSAFLSGRTNLAVIVAPFRALCQDIRGDLAAAFAGEPVSLNEATDSYQMDISIEELVAQKTIFVVTPEKLLYLIRREERLAHEIGLVIYDEGHLFDSPGRGVTYELLLTSLKLSLRPDTQVILISAVIENSKSVAGWLLRDETRVVDGKGLLPTTKSLAFASWRDARGQLRYVAPLDPDEEEFFVPRVIEAITIPRAGRSKAWTFPKRDSGEIALYLGSKLVHNGPVAIFCGRKDSTSKLCARVVLLHQSEVDLPVPVDFSDKDEIEKLQILIAVHLGDESNYASAASLGIFAHHASIPHGLRLAIEHAMKERLIRFVICTSTLAQGVNLPIRYLIITTTYQAGDRLMVRDFHNLMGRAGRAGMHTEGSVIFSSPDVFDSKFNRKERWRWRSAKELLNPDNSEPCVSFLLQVFEPFTYGDPKRPRSITINLNDLIDLLFDEPAAIATLIDEHLSGQPHSVISSFKRFLRELARTVHSIANYLLAHVDFKAEKWEGEVENLIANTLASYLATNRERERLSDLFLGVAARIRERVPSEQTRIVLRQSPLAPSVVLEFASWLTAERDGLHDRMNTDALMPFLLSKIIETSPSPLFQSLSDPNKAFEITARWILGIPYVLTWQDLSAADLRIGGNHRRVTVDDVVAICEGALGYEVAMFLAAIADLCVDDDDLTKAIAQLQRRTKYGLRSIAAIGFYEAGFADRIVASTLADTFPDVGDRQQARQTLRRNADQARKVLGIYPAYFTAVLDEVLR